MKSSDSQTEFEKEKGFTCVRHNVWEQKMLLKNDLSRTEDAVLEVIIRYTIGWQGKTGRKSMKLDIELFKRWTRKRSDHIYIAIKKLVDQQLIVKKVGRTATWLKLNENWFGSILIEKHEKRYRAHRPKLQLVVDNSKKPVDQNEPLDQISVFKNPNLGLQSMSR